VEFGKTFYLLSFEDKYQITWNLCNGCKTSGLESHLFSCHHSSSDPHMSHSEHLNTGLSCGASKKQFSSKLQNENGGKQFLELSIITKLDTQEGIY